MIVAVDIGLRPLSPAGEKILDELEADYGVTTRERHDGGERLYVIVGPDVADHYERHLADYDADWRSHVAPLPSTNRAGVRPPSAARASR